MPFPQSILLVLVATGLLAALGWVAWRVNLRLLHGGVVTDASTYRKDFLKLWLELAGLFVAILTIAHYLNQYIAPRLSVAQVAEESSLSLPCVVELQGDVRAALPIPAYYTAWRPHDKGHLAFDDRNLWAGSVQYPPYKRRNDFATRCRRHRQLADGQEGGACWVTNQLALAVIGMARERSEGHRLALRRSRRIGAVGWVLAGLLMLAAVGATRLIARQRDQFDRPQADLVSKAAELQAVKTELGAVRAALARETSPKSPSNSDETSAPDGLPTSLL